MIPLIGLVVGVLIGSFLNINIPTALTSYMPVAILAALDSIFGGVRAALEKKFDSDIFVSGFFGNIIIAAGLTYLGDKLNVPMYLAAVLVFGGRLFNNFADMRRIVFNKQTGKHIISEISDIAKDVSHKKNHGLSIHKNEKNDDLSSKSFNKKESEKKDEV